MDSAGRGMITVEAKVVISSQKYCVGILAHGLKREDLLLMNQSCELNSYYT
jgi:hypothetical protein